MKTLISVLVTQLLLTLLSTPVRAADAGPPAPVLEWSFYVLLIFALCVAAFVFFGKSSDKRKEPLSNILNARRRLINFAHPDSSVTECIRQMNSENIGALLVVEDDKLTGIFTERDALNKVLAKGIDPNSTKVSDVMTKDPYCMDPTTTVEEAMSIVTHHRFRHLPILDDGKLVGLISSGDLTRWLVEDQVGEIKDLVGVAARRRRQ